MPQPDPIILRKMQCIKAARSIIRLKHSMALDEELVRAIPEIEAEFDKAVLAGRENKLTVDTKLDLAKGMGGSKSQENRTSQDPDECPRLGVV